MHKIIVLFILNIALLSCKTSSEQINQLEISKQYYQALNNSDGNLMKKVLTDSLILKEMDYDYVQIFSQKDYIEDWLKWDSVFSPTYKILEIKQDNDVVKATISKVDKRIHFLHEEPTIWSAVIRFDADKIRSIERKNVVFNEKTWERNKTDFLNWIQENHPELNEFIYDQTESGGERFLKAIALYKNKT
jgi:hypothetical protein